MKKVNVSVCRGHQRRHEKRLEEALGEVSSVSLRNAGVHARGTAYVRDCARGSRGGYSVLVSGNRIGNERPVTAAIYFLKIAVYLICSARFSSCWLLIQ